MACPNQRLDMMTTGKTNDLVIKKFYSASLMLLDGTETSIEINATGLPAGVKYHSNFSIKDGYGGAVDTGETSIWFSKSNGI